MVLYLKNSRLHLKVEVLHNQTKRQVLKFSFQNSLMIVYHITFWFGSFGKSRKIAFNLLASLKNILKTRTMFKKRLFLVVNQRDF